MEAFNFNVSVYVELDGATREQVEEALHAILYEAIGSNLCIPGTDASVAEYDVGQSDEPALRELCGEALSVITNPDSLSEQETARLIAELEDASTFAELESDE